MTDKKEVLVTVDAALIPEGWEAVEVRRPRQGDVFLQLSSGDPMPCYEKWTDEYRLILRRKWVAPE